jgi:hypothetical protein
MAAVTRRMRHGGYPGVFAGACRLSSWLEGGWNFRQLESEIVPGELACPGQRERMKVTIAA